MNKNYHYLLLLVSFFLLSAFRPAVLPPERNSALNFIENKGQWESFVHYKADLGVGSFFLEEERLTFYLIDPAFSLGHNHEDKLYDQLVNCHAYHVNFINPSPKRKYTSKYRQKEHHNYFLGKNAAKWASDVGLFKEVSYENIFEGIDYQVYGKEGAVKYDFIVSPKADASLIKLEYEGVDDIYIKNSKLYVKTSVNDIVEQKPYAFQLINNRKVEVVCHYVLTGNILSFDFPQGYDKTKELVIDPTLVFASYTGSTSDNWGFSATFDAYGHLYGAGASFGSGYPVQVGPFQETFGGGKTDIAISKFSPKGDQLIYTTYLGGSSTEIPQSLIVNAVGQLIVFGSTSSFDYPVTPNTYDESFNSGVGTVTSSNISFPYGSDIIVTIFSESGSELVGSTYIGGSDNEGLNIIQQDEMNYGDDARGEVFLDNENNIYFGSTTQSSDFPTTSGVFSSTYHGGKDGCLVKMSFDLSSMLWSTYLGGEKDDAIFSLRIDENQNLFVCGFTQSADFPTTNNALFKDFQGGASDGFVTKISPNGTQILASTYLGTSETDRAYFIDFDSDDFVYVAGQCESANYPVSDGVYANSKSGQFIHKLNNQLSATEFSTVIGNGKSNNVMSPSAFMVDECDRIYISGWGWEIDGMPVSGNALQSSTDGADFYFMVLDKDATGLAYATYFGGGSAREHVDGGTSRFDKTGTIYQAVCAGCRGFSDFPTTPGAYSNTNNAQNCNLGVIKFDFEQPIIAANGLPSPSFSGCAPFNVSFTNLSKGATSYLWDFGDAVTSSEENPEHLFSEPGNYDVLLIAYGNGACNTVDTAIIKIAVLSNDESALSNIELCDEITLGLIPSFAVPGAHYEWGDGSTQFSFNVSGGGIYTVETTLANCIYLDSFIVLENPFGGSSYEPTGFCTSKSVVLSAIDASVDYYEWNDGLNVQSRSVDKSGEYWVRSHVNTCVHIDSFLVDEYVDYNVIESLTLCQGDTLFFGGEYYISDTLAVATLASTQSCDSTVNLNIVLSYPFADTVEVTLCKDVPFQLTDGSFVTTPGAYTDYDFTVAGCDSTNTTELKYFPVTEYLEIAEEEVIVKLGYSDYLHVLTNSLADSLRWTPGTYLDCDSCLSVEVTPFHTTRYFVMAKDLNGCRIADSVLVTVDATQNVYIPNAFSPNNDGVNDLLNVFSDKGVELINSLRIFDRWGNKVYQGDALTPNNPTEGWDGRYKGKALDPAVFVYVAEVLFLNGDIAVISGDVTLIR